MRGAVASENKIKCAAALSVKRECGSVSVRGGSIFRSKIENCRYFA